MNISDNAYDVAITAIRNCTWKGTEIEKVQRALLEFERLHDHALTEQAKHPLVAADRGELPLPVDTEAAKAVKVDPPDKLVDEDADIE